MKFLVITILHIMFSLSALAQSEIVQSDQIKDTTLKILKLVSMEKSWEMASDKIRLKVFFLNDCKKFQLNKWPMFTNKKSYNNGNENIDSKVYNNILELCSPDLSLENLVPYLSKEVITESMLILNQVYPDDIKIVSGFIREFTMFEDKFESNSSDINKNADWLKKILQHKTTNTYSTYADDIVDTQLEHLFQVDGRVKTIYEILSEEEIESIKDYTESGFLGDDNNCLRNNICPENVKKHIENIQRGLRKLKEATKKSDTDMLFRGTSKVPDFVIKLIDEAVVSGQPVVLDKAFLSSSATADVARTFMTGSLEELDKKKDRSSMLYVLKSKSCMGISEISTSPQEDEFLCPAGMKFKIKKMSIQNVYELEEVEDLPN